MGPCLPGRGTAGSLVATSIEDSNWSSNGRALGRALPIVLLLLPVQGA